MFDKNLLGIDGMKPIMGALAVFALLSAACLCGQAILLAGTIAAFWAGESLESQIFALAGFFACFLLNQLIGFARDTMLDSFSTKAVAGMHEKLLERIFDARYMVASRLGAGSIATSATEGIGEIQTYLRIIPPKIIGMMTISLPLLAVEFALDWVSGIILLVAFPVIIGFMILLGKQARARAEKQYVAYHLLSNRFVDTLRGLDAIVANSAGDVEARGVFEFSERLRRSTLNTLATATLSSAVLDLVATFGVAAVAMMLAFRLLDGSIDLATGLACLMLAPEYFAPIRSFAADFHASLDGKNALAAFLEITSANDSALQTENETAPAQTENETAQAGDSVHVSTPAEHESAPAVEDAGEPACAIDHNLQKESDDAQLARLENNLIGSHANFTQNENQFSDERKPSFDLGEVAAIEFRDVSFQYPDAHIAAIEGLSFAVSQGEKVAVIGMSGAGKSTLASLAAGFFKPKGGSIATCGKLHYIPQSPYIFRDTLANNIRFYFPAATDKAVQRAIEVVGLQPLVDELPSGINTLIGEGGRGLSGGQAHRIALARVLLDESTQILVFDEPTAHLDIETELELKQHMLPLMQGKTVLFATHRRHWIADMDRVIELDGGRIVHDRKVGKNSAGVKGEDALTNEESLTGETNPSGATNEGMLSPHECKGTLTDAAPIADNAQVAEGGDAQ